ncbi:MAG: cadherin-like domain-containing protein [Desulfamplus sp.]|nr:cadherin-like domain-containing protein [Desulfamplus sp.]MBF0390838.1 cadherin-like domain-containing protein [Desulfamplus sp.]
MKNIKKKLLIIWIVVAVVGIKIDSIYASSIYPGEDFYSTSYGESLWIDVYQLISNDYDIYGSPLTIVDIIEGEGGSLDFSVLYDSGFIIFTPYLNFSGRAYFTYILSNLIEEEIGTVWIDVGEPVVLQNPPNAEPDFFKTSYETILKIDANELIANDYDIDGNPLTIIDAISGFGGEATFNPFDYTISFSPKPKFTGVAEFEYVLSDGLDTSTGLVTVEVGEPSNKGSLKVLTSPACNEMLKFKWRVDSGEWHTCGSTVDDIYVGDHDIEFYEVAGWIKPENMIVTVEPDQTTTVTGVYTKPDTVPPPKAPRLTVSIDGINMNLSWSALLGANEYLLFYAPHTGKKPESVNPSNFDSISVGNITKLSGALWQGAKYYAAVKALNEGGQSPFSNVVEIIIENSEPDIDPVPDPNPDPDPEPSSSMGRAIIIAGGGGSTTLYPYSNKLCQQMYRLLKQRGFTDNDIIYINPQPPDIDEDGYLDNELLDYDLFEPESQLKEAFAKAAQSQSGQFILYVHGHADKDYLKITKEYEISSLELKSLINTIPKALEQVIVLDTCYSGSFLDDLAGQSNGAAKRVVLTSADDKTVAWNVEVTNFSEKFIRSLRSGHTLKEAFDDAEDMIAGNSQLFGGQTPWLDDNGDGLYNAKDGVTAATIYLGKKGVQAAEPPAITRVHPVIDIPEGKADTILWVETSPSGDDRVKKVSATLISPTYSLTEYQGDATQFSENSVELKYNGALNRYEALYGNFRQKGKWKIAYRVQGSDGEWSDIKFGEVNAGGLDKVISVSVLLNQSQYHIADKLQFNVTLNGEAAIDLYVAVIFPQGYFQTFAYPQSPSVTGVLTPYKSNITSSGQQTLSILDWPLPQGLIAGTYYGCAAVTQAGSDPWNIELWYDYGCKTFEVQ